MKVKEFLKAYQDKEQMIWNDPDPIKGVDYTVSSIFINSDLVDEDSIILITYNSQSEAEVLISELSIKPKAEFVEWSDIRDDLKLPQSDNNDGYIFGLAYLSDDGVDTLDCEWFLTNEERYISAKDFNVLNYVG